MLTIFSCMWPSCSVNCDSLDAIERHVRTHLGCKQYESIGDEDFYYEETEVDEPTYLAIFDHCLIGSPARLRHQNPHHQLYPNHHHYQYHADNGSASQVGGPKRAPGSPSHNSDGLSSGQSFASSSPATSPVCSTDSSPPSSSSSSLSYANHHCALDGGQCGANSIANSIDWSQFLASPSLIALEQKQLASYSGGGSGACNRKHNNLSSQQFSASSAQSEQADDQMIGGASNKRWPASNYAGRHQQVYYMEGIRGRDHDGQAKVTTAQLDTCDGSSFMEQRQQYLKSDLSQFNRRHPTDQRKSEAAYSQQQRANGRRKSLVSNGGGSRQQTKSRAGSKRATDTNRKWSFGRGQNQTNHSTSSLQFAMQLTGRAQSPVSPSNGTCGATYGAAGELGAHGADNREDGARQRTGERAHSLRRGRKPSAKRAEAEANNLTPGRRLASSAGTGRRRQGPGRGAGGASRKSPAKMLEINENHLHHHQQHLNDDNNQQFFQIKHQSSKSLAMNKTITKTSRPTNAAANCNGQMESSAVVPDVVPGEREEMKRCEPTAAEEFDGAYMNSSSSLCSSPSVSARLGQSSSSRTPQRRVRGENRKCRKVYGMERRDQWCTQCKWKKACTRFSAEERQQLAAGGVAIEASN